MLYPAGLLKNKKTGRWHPIIFQLRPAPSSDPEDTFQRYKSKGHHTEGFDTREDAVAFFETDSVKSDGIVWIGMEWDWNGEDIPAMTQWFAKSSPFLTEVDEPTQNS